MSHGASSPTAVLMRSPSITRRSAHIACTYSLRKSIPSFSPICSDVEVFSVPILARASIASVPTLYKSATERGISWPMRSSAIEISMESISGFDVMRLPSASSGSRSQI
eukprot:scaffold63815_cov32-Tisochrysis_lutea.AAC.2